MCSIFVGVRRDFDDDRVVGNGDDDGQAHLSASGNSSQCADDSGTIADRLEKTQLTARNLLLGWRPLKEPVVGPEAGGRGGKGVAVGRRAVFQQEKSRVRAAVWRD